MTYTKTDYEQEKQTRYVNPNDPYDSCGHVENGWCGVCLGAQPSFVRRQFKRVD